MDSYLETEITSVDMLDTSQEEIGSSWPLLGAQAGKIEKVLTFAGYEVGSYAAGYVKDNWRAMADQAIRDCRSAPSSDNPAC